MAARAKQRGQLMRMVTSQTRQVHEIAVALDSRVELLLAEQFPAS